MCLYLIHYWNLEKACQQQNKKATMVYRSLHGLAPDYVLDLKAYKLKDSENKPNVRTQTITKIASIFAMVPVFGTLSCEVRQAVPQGQF